MRQNKSGRYWDDNGLDGCGNTVMHQALVGGLAIAIRETLDMRTDAIWDCLHEIDVDKFAPYKDYRAFGLLGRYNFDLAVFNSRGFIHFIIEVSNGHTDSRTWRKLRNCFRKMTTLDEAFLVEIDGENNVHFLRLTPGEDEPQTCITSHSEFLGIDLAEPAARILCRFKMCLPGH